MSESAPSAQTPVETQADEQPDRSAESVSTAERIIRRNAREFGAHFKQGGWRLGFLVARSTKSGKPGRPSKASENPSPEMDSDGKVSFTEFAKLAGVAQSHVSYHYMAWNLAAGDGLYPPAEQLSPGSSDGLRDDIEDDDDDARDKWLVYYRKARGTDSEGELSPSQPRNKASGSQSGDSDSAAGSKVGQAVEALADTSIKLSKRLNQVVERIGPTLMGDSAELDQFAEKLRRTRFALDKYCQEIDLLLERIGYGDFNSEHETQTPTPASA
jgi:hypothetical protein